MASSSKQDHKIKLCRISKKIINRSVFIQKNRFSKDNNRLKEDLKLLILGINKNHKIQLISKSQTKTREKKLTKKTNYTNKKISLQK